MSVHFTVRQVEPERTFALRHRVLRGHEPIEKLRLPSDDDPASGTFAAFDDATGDVIGTAAVFREPPPWDPHVDSAWRLRGMATAERWRSKGVGSAVLAAVVEHVVSAGGRLLWCNARVPAVNFYERAGFERVGEEWDEPYIGPHVTMARKLRPQKRVERPMDQR